MVEVLVCSGCHNKISWTRWLNQKQFISHSLEAERAKIRVLPYLVTGESSLSGSQAAFFLLCFHTEVRERAFRCLLCKHINPIGSRFYLYDLI